MIIVLNKKQDDENCKDYKKWPPPGIKPLPRKCSFNKIPGVKTKLTGTVIDEIPICFTVKIEDRDKEYINLLQLIEWDNQPEEKYKKELRLAYYYRDKKNSKNVLKIY